MPGINRQRAEPPILGLFIQTEITFFQPSEIAVHTSWEPMSVSKDLQQAVWSVDREQPASNIRTMEAIVDEELANRTQVLQLLGTFAALALVLAALGIYGVLSYVVSQRRREIGLRMAIGASQWDIIRDILGYSARLTVAGLAAGIVAAIAATRLLSTLLCTVSHRSTLPRSSASPGCCCWWRLSQRLCPHAEPRRSIRRSPTAAFYQVQLHRHSEAVEYHQ
jgi:hypothetical protein